MLYRAKKAKVFISFDYTNDNRYRYLLNAIAKNPKFNIEFVDSTPGEIQSNNISRIKSVLTTRIRESTHTLVIIGEYINSYHTDRDAIGQRNWQWWEIEKSAEESKKLIGVRLKPSYSLPTPLSKRSYSFVEGFDIDEIEAALNNA